MHRSNPRNLLYAQGPAGHLGRQQAVNLVGLQQAGEIEGQWLT